MARARGAERVSIDDMANISRYQVLCKREVSNWQKKKDCRNAMAQYKYFSHPSHCVIAGVAVEVRKTAANELSKPGTTYKASRTVDIICMHRITAQ